MKKEDFPIQLEPYSVARVFEVLRSMPKPQIKVTSERSFFNEPAKIFLWNKDGVVLYTYECSGYVNMNEVLQQLKEEFGYAA